MKNFTYVRANSVEDAVNRATSDRDALFIAGGTNLVDRLKVFLDEPSQLVDVSRLTMKQISATDTGGFKIGALVTNTALANHIEVRRNYPLLARAILAGASQQIRNMATVGGNLMQCTRCPYYYDTAFACNKRQPDTGCPAATGINRTHAILGASDRCVAINPSDMSVAMAALDATVEVQGVAGKREIPFIDFHRLPGDTPERDTNLEPGELITAVILPAMTFAKSGVYLKLRDRASYAFALVSVATVLEIEGEQITNARIALGGVAHKPWRTIKAEEFLIGKPAAKSSFDRAAAIALQDAQPLTHNKFKVELSKRIICRALAISAQGGRGDGVMGRGFNFVV
ncbi:MAG: xanthine dehydrogenase family protein subunit M [Waterburya sp.]